VATTTLVTDLMAGGREVLDRLETANVSIDTALWLQDEETDEWRLVIASDYVDRHGSRPVYERLAELLPTPTLPDLRIDDVRVLTTRDRLVKDLKRLVGTNSDLQDIRLDHVAIGGELFRSARIYRVSGGSLEKDARVKVNGRLGTVRAVVPTPHGPRYLVMYDLRPEDVRPLGTEPTSPAGQDFAADELEFLYVVRTGG
jgi:hypothetical protein